MNTETNPSHGYSEGAADNTYTESTELRNIWLRKENAQLSKENDELRENLSDKTILLEACEKALAHRNEKIALLEQWLDDLRKFKGVDF